MKVSQYINANQNFNEGEDILPEDELGRFYQSEVWKVSQYVSTTIPACMLTVLVSIVEFAEGDVTLLI